MRALDHGEGKSLIVHGRETGEGADRFSIDYGANSGQGREGAGGRGQAGTENAEVAVDVADAAESGDHFLADVAAFGGADGVGFEAGFRRKRVGSNIDSPQRQTAGDPYRLPIREG
jgi:hypothetical protein